MFSPCGSRAVLLTLCLASTEYSVAITAAFRPEFTIADFQKKDYGSGTADDGLEHNPCWPKNLAPLDPGWALMNYDEYNDQYPLKGTTRQTPYNYKKAHDANINGGQNKYNWP